MEGILRSTDSQTGRQTDRYGGREWLSELISESVCHSLLSADWLTCGAAAVAAGVVLSFALAAAHHCDCAVTAWLLSCHEYEILETIVANKKCRRGERHQRSAVDGDN